ncbi:PHD and RING finger domain-containing protein 1 [Fundulus heteroclitus]|uniref:PHD and RING finger domain-containing protein 1 n=1 Tax=Fundulus heteroclitus TaxID=8078 RepID=UPI00165B6B35|nr:PHD and RING finger domain-containing protein 1 [Fundulus heteroclitus]
MDEDDSQDELINRSSSHSKGKRAALWAISDDSDDLEEESEEGDSDSDDDEEEEHNANGEDDEEEEEASDEEDDIDEEEDDKPEKGAFGGTSTDFAEMSSDEDREKCPICLNSFSSQPVATPENCEHYFCFDCILEWTKNANSCPVDRIIFNNIYLRKSYGGKVKKIVTVQKPVKAGQEETVDLDLEQTNCEVCGGSDREDRLLLCDGCDAGYHMECLTPPLDAVPVEEWFCPECEANNRQSRGPVEEVSDTESLSSTPRPATSRSRPSAVGPTRAIARTQQSERVRANVNRHRITQARSSQLAPTYLIQSTWLDETINAVVAGLNTAVYVRDITPRAPSSRRRRTVKRRKARRKKTSVRGKNGQAESAGVKRRKRRVRKSKSRKKAFERKVATPRSRIANNLGIVKDKKSSSLPTVYRPSENTLSNMRADIGAASLSIYGDPFDLDPFVDHEEVEERAQVTSLLEAKRRGISRSALRSHQPVARPVTAGLSRRGVDLPHLGSVVEAAPVPDLLGSILSGQSMLLMDSSDVVISRDGSLKASKPTMPSTAIPSSRKNSSSSDTSALNSPGCSYSLGDNSASLHHNGNLPGSSPTSVNGLLPSSSSHLPSFVPPSANHNQPRPHSDFTPRANPSLQPPRPNRPTPANGMRPLRETPSSSVHPVQDCSLRDKGSTLSQSQQKRAPVKPMWVDVSVLPRIPKIRRESSSVTTDAAGRTDGSRGSSSSTGASNGPGLPESGMNSLSRDKGRQQSVDQQKGHADGQAHKNKPERASSSSAFSNSFASSSSSSSAPTSQARHSSFSSSSAVSFRINSSGNSWHARRLSLTSPSPAGSNVKGQWRGKEEKAKKKQMHKDKKTLLASCTAVPRERDNIYDPFNPMLSDSNSSSDEGETTSLNLGPESGTNRGKPPAFGSKKGSVPRSQDAVQVKTESETTEEKPGSSQRAATPEWIFSEECIKAEKESSLVEVRPEKQTVFLNTMIKKEPNSDESETSESESCVDGVLSGSEIKSEIADTMSPVYQHVEHIKAEKNTEENSEHSAETSSRSLLNSRNDSSASCSSTVSKTQTEETRSDSPSRSGAPLRESGHKKQTSKTSKDQPSSSSETDRARREDHHPALSKGGKKKEGDKGREKDRSSRRSRSRERRRARSTSDSSEAESPDRTYRKRRRSRSRSKDKTKRRSRSCSSSSSRERSRTKKHTRKSDERNERPERRRVSKDKRRGRSRSKSRSKSRSRSRTRSRSKDRKRQLSRSRSRSRSRERRKDRGRQHTTVSSRDKGDSRFKDRRQRTRSSSRERRKEGSTRSTVKTSAPQLLSSRDRNERKKEKVVAQRNLEKNKCPEVKKEELPSSSFVSQVKNEDKNVEGGESQAKEILIEIKTKKEIKKEKPQPVDMFEDCPIGDQMKSEEKDLPSSAVSKSDDEPEEDRNQPESSETAGFKPEPSPTQECPSPPVSSPPATTMADPLHDSPCQPEPQNTAGAAAPIKQEPPESDDDFNVDVMLDSLDPVKPESTEGSGAGAAPEKDATEKDEGEQISPAVGSKSKAPVKRVTWNIQEPEGPQPGKSPSKLALYKMKLKQEGSRKPSLPVQPSTQDTVVDPSQKGVAGLQTASSSCGGLNPGELSSTEQGEAEEGDLSRKDKYLKKLHMQERAVEEVKLAIKPFYQRRDINKDEYKEILRKAVQKVCHSKSGEINPVKVGNLIKAYVEKYKHARKHKKEEDSAKVPDDQSEPMKISDSP